MICVRGGQETANSAEAKRAVPHGGARGDSFCSSRFDLHQPRDQPLCAGAASGRDLDVPVTIRDSTGDRNSLVHGCGTTYAGLRWTAVTIDGGETPNGAERITIPQDVFARIAPTALPRSSLIISD